MRAMKDSGIEYVGQIPLDWEVYKNKYLFNSAKNIVGADFEQYQLLSLTTKGVIEKDINNADGKLPESFGTYQSVKAEDLVLCLFDLDVSAVFSGISNFDGMISPAYKIVRCKSNLFPMYADYWFRAVGYDRSYLLYSKSLRNTINADNFKEIPMVVPSITEQQRIASYLDQKVALIDNIIEKTKESIEEYKKYKQSLITETVTKGLNPDVKMKDSGIEWIGEIPEHWSVTKPHRVCDIIRGNSGFQKDDLKNDGDYVALQYGKTYKVDEVTDDFQFYVSDVFYKENQVVEKGYTILVSTSETMEDLGHSCYYNRGDLALLGGEQMCLKPTDLVIGKFLYYASRYFKTELNQYATGLKVYRFRVDDIKKICIVLPPTNEQKIIASYLDRKIPMIENAIMSKDALVSELESYKKSLIYEVVTGKKEV